MTSPEPSAKPNDARGSAPRLARHLARCAPCRDGLDAMSAQSHVLGRLGRGKSTAAGEGEAGADGEHHLVAEVLEACAEDGREKVADLLYEMACACRSLIPEDLKPGEVTKSPDWVEKLPVDVLGATATQMCGRVPNEGIASEEIPASIPNPTNAASAARSCLALLEQIEGSTGRRRVLEAGILQSEERFLEVIDALEPMLMESLPEWLWLGVRWHLTAALLRTRQFEKAAGVGEAALSARPNDRSLIFNTASAYAFLGDGNSFDRTCAEFSSCEAGMEDLDWWRALIADEAQELAAELGRTRQEILESFPLPTIAGGTDS